ncbi:MAG: FG-GAP-like repeat-containing protein [Candidatus Sulfotelmatobacter sp.]
MISRVAYMRVLAVVVTLTTPLLAQFETRGSFVAETFPYSIAVGDFNHDGKLDLAVVSVCCPSGGVSILLGKGDGTFQTAVDYPAGSSPESVVAVDLNHDGNLDLAVASQSAYISILLGNGDGTFQPATESPAVPTFERHITTGDFNGDGKPDLVMRADQSAVTVLLGNGDGTFQNALTTYAPFDVTALGVGDFNRDGKLDLVTAGTFGGDSSVNVWIGNGDGTFDYGANYPGGEVPEAIAVADFNRDGKLDLAINDSEGVGISVMLGNGDGTFQTAVEYPIPFNNWVTAADLSGDGKLDLAVINGFAPNTGVTVFPGNGDGTFGSGTFYSAGSDANFVAIGDFNGDGKKDMAVTDNRYDDVIVLLNTGVASFSPTTPLVFKKQSVGTKSAAQKVTLTNTGKTPLSISAMKASGQFAMSSTCGKGVAAGKSCTISVTFSPQSQGAKSGTVTINDSASSKPMVIELSGTGT